MPRNLLDREELPEVEPLEEADGLVRQHPEVLPSMPGSLSPVLAEIMRDRLPLEAGIVEDETPLDAYTNSAMAGIAIPRASLLGLKKGIVELKNANSPVLQKIGEYAKEHVLRNLATYDSLFQNINAGRRQAVRALPSQEMLRSLVFPKGRAIDPPDDVRQTVLEKIGRRGFGPEE